MAQEDIAMRFGDLTFRQYMALTFILSCLKFEQRYPSREELKKFIGIKTDRELKITLVALAKKKFLYFKGLETDPVVEVPEGNRWLYPFFANNLILTDQYKSYEELKRLSKEEKIKKIPRELKLVFKTSLIRSTAKEINNERMSVHRWYGLLQDFSPVLVWKKLETYRVQEGQLVLDPFVGSGTTAVTSKIKGLDCIAIDSNPVSYFVTSVKSNWALDLGSLREEFGLLLQDFAKALPYLSNYHLRTRFTKEMPRKELNQWLKPKDKNMVAYLKERIEEIEDPNIRGAITLGLLNSSKASSNVTFCPGTTFYPFRKKKPFLETLTKNLEVIYEDLCTVHETISKPGKVICYNADSREMSNFIKSSSIDFVFTSPPYPNDLEYTRQTRLELYLLNFVHNMWDVREIKKRMIKGSTKLIFRDSESDCHVERFNSIQRVVRELGEAFSSKEWGWNYPRMVKEYFGDIYLFLLELKEVLKEEAHALLVVGDQTYKNILIPVGQIILELAKETGFTFTSLETLRIRRSTMHNIPLKEEIIILKK